MKMNLWPRATYDQYAVPGSYSISYTKEIEGWLELISEFHPWQPKPFADSIPLPSLEWQRFSFENNTIGSE